MKGAGSLRADVSISFASRGKGSKGNGDICMQAKGWDARRNI